MLNVVMKPNRRYLEAQRVDEQLLYIMLRLLPETPPDYRPQAVDVGLVIDSSGSMHTQVDGMSKLERAAEAARRIINHPALNTQGRITLVTFNSQSTVLYPLQHVRANDLYQGINALLRQSGSTRMALGMEDALRQFQGASTPQTPKRLFLLTDGLTCDEAECRSLAHQMQQLNLPIIAVGIGTEYNQDLLIDLAEITRGIHFHLQNMHELDNLLNQQLQSAAQELYTNMRLRIQTVRGVAITNIWRSRPTYAQLNGDGQDYFLGNLDVRGDAVYLIEMIVSGLARNPSRARLAQFFLSSSNPNGTTSELFRGDLFIEFTNNTDLFSQTDPEVMQYLQQKVVVETVDQATKLAKQGETRRAAELLTQAAAMTQDANLTRQIEETRRTLMIPGVQAEEATRFLRTETRTKQISPETSD